MNTHILLDFSIGRDHCRLINDPKNNKLIITALRISKTSTLRISEEFSNTEKAKKRCLKSYERTLHLVFEHHDSNIQKTLDLFMENIKENETQVK